MKSTYIYIKFGKSFWITVSNLLDLPPIEFLMFKCNTFVQQESLSVKGKPPADRFVWGGGAPVVGEYQKNKFEQVYRYWLHGDPHEQTD